MAESLSFKVHLTEIGNEDQPEVGNFVLDKELRTSFRHLQERVTSVFPSLENKIFTVNWTDEDSDIITIDSDEEFAIALAEMKGPVYDIKICVKGGEKKDGPNKSNTKDEVHLDVTCDGCNKSILEFHYKCLVCDDFDLCGICSGAGVHPDHNMMRIASPTENFAHQEKEENQEGQEDGENDNQLHGKRFGGGRPGRGMFGVLRVCGGSRGGFYGGPRCGLYCEPRGMLCGGPRGGHRGGLYGGPCGNIRGGPRGGVYGGPHRGVYGGPRGGLYGGLRGGVYGGPCGGLYGGPRGGVYGGPRGGLYGGPRGVLYDGSYGGLCGGHSSGYLGQLASA